MNSDTEGRHIRRGRGFKTDAERLSEALRQELNLPLIAPLPAIKLAKHLKNVKVSKVEWVPGLSNIDLSHLKGHGHGYSAVTIVMGDYFRIIYNSGHSPARRESDMMHETSHILLHHEPAEIICVDDLMFRTYDETQEEEAKFLGGCLQISRKGLVWAVKHQKMTDEQIQDYFTASKLMVQYRKNMLGLNRRRGR